MRIDLWTPVDRWVERAVLGRLPSTQVRVLEGLLALGTGAGLVVATLAPNTATMALLTPLVMACFFLGPRFGWLLAPLTLVYALFDSSALGVLTFLAGGSAGIAGATITLNKYREAKRRGDELARGLQVARQVQRGLEPPATMEWGPLKVATRIEACELLGGDFVCLRPLGPGRFGMLVGDVMGNGVRASLAAAFVTGLYSELARGGLGPAAVLDAVNRRFCEVFGPHDWFVTLTALEYDARLEEWRIALAGQEPPFLLRGDGRSDELEELIGIAAGIEPLEEYREIRRPALAGDQLLLASDGLAPEGLPWEITRVALHECRTRPVSEALDTTFEMLRARGGGRLDDATALLIRRP